MISKENNPGANEKVLMIFVKYPEAGKVKTRLAKDVGYSHVASIYKGFVERIIENTKSGEYFQKIIFTPNKDKKKFSEWLGPEIEMHAQEGKDLGERLFNAFKKEFELGAKKVIAIGTDSPLVGRDIIVEALDKLNNSDCVIGPAKDGGYYLLGLSRLEKSLFEQIDWSTERVFNQTKKAAQKKGLSLEYLDESADVDTLEDFLALEKQMRENAI